MTQQELLFALIRSGLDLPVSFPFPLLQGKTWYEIRQLARKQRVEALCFDGIAKLPAAKQPPMPLRLEWGGNTIRTELQVNRYNKILQAVTAWLQTEKINFILLKGSATANRYPRPSRRECGDIDLLITDNHFSSACLLLQQKGAVLISEAPEKHTSFLWQGVVIELHHTLIDLCSPRAIRYIRHLDCHTVSTTALINGRTYPVLQPAFESAYMMAHLLHHLWTDEVRLRQICDWMVLMHRHGDNADNREFATYIRKMRVEKMFPVLLCIGLKHFGLPSGKWKKHVKDTDYLMAEKWLRYILRPGQDADSKNPHGRYFRVPAHWKNAGLYMTHLWRFFPLSPIEALWFFPTRIWRFLYKKLHCSRKATASCLST